MSILVAIIAFYCGAGTMSALTTWIDDHGRVTVGELISSFLFWPIVPIMALMDAFGDEED